MTPGTEYMSPEEFQRQYGRGSRKGGGSPSGKSHTAAKRVTNCPSCGFNHDSQVEAKRCKYLRVLTTIRVVRHYDVHPVITLENGVRWFLDFFVHLEGSEASYYEDVKGRPDIKRDTRLKLQMFINSRQPFGLHIIEPTGYGKKYTGLDSKDWTIWTPEGYLQRRKK